MRINLIVLICLVSFHPMLSATILAESTTCTPLYITTGSNRNAKIDIRAPGRYCLKLDIHARFDFADHPAEGRQIHIWGSDVELDLAGHTIGRGRYFVQPGGIGIELEENSKNIRIENGILENFSVGIYRTGFKPNQTEIISKPNKNENTYIFRTDKIIFENIIFKNCKESFLINSWK